MAWVALFLAGVLIFGEAANPLKLASVALILVGVVGLRLFGGVDAGG